MIEIIPNWHPIFVHFTVALLSVAVVLFVVVRFMDDGRLRQQWETVAQWNLWLGAIITIVTVAMGVVAYNSVAHDTPSHAAMTEHRNWALVTAALFLCLAAWSAIRARAGQGMNVVFLLGLLIAGGMLLSTAWHGGEVVYRYGLGVMSLPKTDNHGHAGSKHDHSDVDDHAGMVAEPHHADKHGEEKSQKDDVENCELPEVEMGEGKNSKEHEHVKAHDDLSGQAHAEPEKSDSHHNDGHDDHEHKH